MYVASRLFKSSTCKLRVELSVTRVVGKLQGDVQARALTRSCYSTPPCCAVPCRAVLQAHGTFDMKEPYYRQLNVWAQALPQASPATQQQASTIPGLSVICGDGTLSPQMQPLQQQQQVLQAGAVSMLPNQLVVGGDAAGAQEVGMAGAGAVAGLPVADAAAAATGAAAPGAAAAGSGAAQSATAGVCALMV